jgi:hypothetical protein
VGLLSDELRGKWTRVKARFHAVSHHLQATDLELSIHWKPEVLTSGPAGSDPPAATAVFVRSPRRGSVHAKLSKKADAKSNSLNIDRSEPVVVQARTLFDLFDVDKSGGLDRLEFKKLMRAVGGDIGVSGPEFSVRVKSDFDAIDVSDDSKVSFAEFHRYFRLVHKELIAAQKQKERDDRGRPSKRELVGRGDSAYVAS